MPGMNDDVKGQADGQAIPRYAGLTTFARLPRREDVTRCDVAVVGIPFDSGVTYRPGARFGPVAHPAGLPAAAAVQPGSSKVSPFARPAGRRRGRHRGQPVRHRHRGRRDRRAGRPNSSSRAPGWSSSAATTPSPTRCCAPTIAGTARSRCCTSTPTSTPGTPTSARRCTHGTPFRRAAEEGLFVPGHSAHVGIRGSLYAPERSRRRRRIRLHRRALRATSSDARTDDVIEQLRDAVGDRPLYVSIDIDVLDPAHAPGDRHAGGGGHDQPRTAGDPARPGRRSTWSAPTSSRCRRPTTTPRSPASPRPTSPTS